MPTDSKCLNFAFLIQSFSRPGDGILQKLGYDCLCECDASPWVGVVITSPVRIMEGNFLSKRFTSSGTESGMGGVGDGSAAGKTERGGSNMD